MVLTRAEFSQHMRSHAHFNELLYVIYGLKPVTRFALIKTHIPAYQRVAEEYGLFVVEGSSIDLEQEPGTAYSNKGIVDDNAKYQLMYFAKVKEHAQFARMFEEQGNHSDLGDILGYPACCCEAFSQWKGTPSHDFLPEVLAKHDNFSTASFNWQLNICLRYADFSILAHFPCSFQCVHSKSIAQQYYDVLNTVRPEYCRMLQKYLKGTILHIPGQGTLYLHKAQQKKSSYTFESMSGTCAPHITRALRHNEVSGGAQHIVIDGDMVRAFLVTFA